MDGVRGDIGRLGGVTACCSGDLFVMQDSKSILQCDDDFVFRPHTNTSASLRQCNRRGATIGVQLWEGKGDCPGIGVGQEMNNVIY